MKVAVNRNLKGRNIGPLIFTRRLFDFLSKRGVKLVSPSDRPDIYFAVISYNKKDVPKGSKIVLRVDGIYWNQLDKNMRMNKGIFGSIKSADGVVYQSQFCKKCCEANKAFAKKSAIILNAVDQSKIQSIKSAALPHLPGLVACAKWRPTKRPLSVCNAFLASGIPHHLYMVGEPSNKKVEHPKIHWLGALSTEESVGVMKSCSHAIHLAKFDPCPNAVIEEVSVGLPVLHTANGGTPEIVKDNGICAPFDAGWKFNPLKEDIDSLKPEEVAPYLSQLVQMDEMPQRDDLDMQVAADKYYKFFQEVLK